MNYEDILADIYSSYLAVKEYVAHRLDAEVRDPQLILNIAQTLNIIPPADAIITVTGSKGKGTVSRSAAALMQTLRPTESVGLLVSPHESEHTDRMRINGVAISKPDFCDLYVRLRPNLMEARSGLPDDRYLGPSGTFLLLALAWFKERRVKHYVLEAGRGAKYDEVGRLPAAVAVVTSIFMEHPEYLGPTLEDIARNKLAIGDTARCVVLDDSAAMLNDSLQVLPSKQIHLVATPGLQSNAPMWIEKDWLLACEAVGIYLREPSAKLQSLRKTCLTSASFFAAHRAGVDFIIDGTIARASLDDLFVDHLLKTQSSRMLVVLSIPDDKNVRELVDFFQSRGVDTRHVVVDGAGTLAYEVTRANYSSGILCTVDMHASHNLPEMLLTYCASQGVRSVYALGTQTFVRLCRGLL